MEGTTVLVSNVSDAQRVPLGEIVAKRRAQLTEKAETANAGFNSSI